jgi:hypothetical protein
MKKLIIKGEPVTYNFFPGENYGISHGEFSIVNPSQDIQNLKINECFFLDGNNKSKLENFFIYSGDSEFTNIISMPAASEIKIRITFPFHAINEKNKNTYGVEVIASHENNRLKAISEIKVEWEKEDN